MMKSRYLGMLAVALLLASCSSIRHTADIVPVQTKVVNFTVADVEVQPHKVSKTYSWSYNPFRSVSINTVKENTEAALVNEADADVLLEPQYIVEKRGFLRGGSVTVTGFPAKYVGFHKMTPEEAEVIKNASVPEKPEHKKRWLFF